MYNLVSSETDSRSTPPIALKTGHPDYLNSLHHLAWIKKGDKSSVTQSDQELTSGPMMLRASRRTGLVWYCLAPEPDNHSACERTHETT